MCYSKEKNKPPGIPTVLLTCAPTGIRTPVLALKGLRPGPLDDGGGCLLSGVFISRFKWNGNDDLFLSHFSLSRGIIRLRAA